MVTGILTVIYARCWLPECHGTGGRIVVYLSAFALAVAMFSGSVVGLLWVMGPGEQVVTYQGDDFGQMDVDGYLLFPV